MAVIFAFLIQVVLVEACDATSEADHCCVADASYGKKCNGHKMQWVAELVSVV